MGRIGPVVLACCSLFIVVKSQDSALNWSGFQKYGGQRANVTAKEHCPNLGDFPILYEPTKEFYGFHAYGDRGHAIPDLGCNGYQWDVMSGGRGSAPEGTGFPIGSLYVFAGCTFYGFTYENYQGEYREYAGPLFLSQVPDDAFGGRWCYYDDWNWRTPCCHSFIVDCRMKYPDCAPADSWQTVGYFDNSQSSLTSKYTWKQSVGSSWTEEMTNGFSVSNTVEIITKAGFFEIFETSLGISITTGYNWSQTSTAAQETVTEHEVSTDVPPGTILQIEHAVGECGGTKVMTEMFRSITTKAGKIISNKVFTV